MMMLEYMLFECFQLTLLLEIILKWQCRSRCLFHHNLHAKASLNILISLIMKIKINQNAQITAITSLTSIATPLELEPI
jgi:hypothetical protein